MYALVLGSASSRRRSATEGFASGTFGASFATAGALGAVWSLSAQDSDCVCGGAWGKFHEMLNFTVAYLPKDSGALGAKAASMERLCHDSATPLIREVLHQLIEPNGRLKRDGADLADPDFLDFGDGWCPTGLTAALSVCAAVHARLAAQAQGVEEEKLDGDWHTALDTWPQLLPTGCEFHIACLAYLEGLLALSTLRHCGPCISDAGWFITAQEVNDNVVRWLRHLWHYGPESAPPAWQGRQGPSLPVRHRVVAAAGAWAAHGGPKDGSGASDMLRRLVKLWSLKATSHFERIFGVLGDLATLQGRGHQGIQVRLHEQDFAGPRSHLRFYIYDLPKAAHSEVLQQLHGRVREKEAEPAACNLGLAPCIETSNSEGAFNVFRPFATEATFLAKLLSAPEVLVENPEEASYFVVPFLSSMWCTLSSPMCWVRCSGQRPLNALLPFLTYFNATTAHRHLFLGTDSVGDLPRDLQMQPLVLHYGPSPCGNGLITPPSTLSCLRETLRL